jgi:nitrite reductase/ring-hydroxylating ferredoxin subunit
MHSNQSVDRLSTQHTNVTPACGACPIETDRRTFLHDMAIAVMGTLAVIGVAPGSAFARSARAVEPLRDAGAERRYELPRGDGVSIDEQNEVILARWQNRVYAFSLLCPHRGTKLVWHADESRVYCPKHKARFRADGLHDSGRATRALDRYDLRLEAGTIVVDLDALHRVDDDPRGWSSAVVAVGDAARS